MMRVSIIGFGWLGMRLANYLMKKEVELTGTVRTIQKKNLLEKQFAQVTIFELDKLDGKEQTDLASFYADYFLLSIPPSTSVNYVEKMNALIDLLFKQNPKASVMYTSSISVYGNDIRKVTENSSLCPQTENAKKIVQVENHLISNYFTQSIVLRLGGLVGKDRHPVNYFAGRKNIAKSKAPINLVYEEDICNLISHFLTKKIKCGIFNLCCDEHPTKQDYYTWTAKQLELTAPEFDERDNKKDKIVLCNAIKSIKFELKFKSPFDFPIQ